MAEHRRRPDLPPLRLTIGEVAQQLGHSPSWLGRECLNRRQVTGFPASNRVVRRADEEPTNNWSDHHREQREQRNGPGHRQ